MGRAPQTSRRRYPQPNFFTKFPPTELLRSISVSSNQETLKHILIGDCEAIIATQKLLAKLRYAEAPFWTQPQPIGATGEYISVLIKRSASNMEK